MKSDIDRLMAARGLDALAVLGGEGDNPHRHYLTNGVKASAIVIKKRGEPPTLIVNNMEVEEAQKSGLPVLTHNDFKLFELWEQYKDDRATMFVKTWERFLAHFGIVRGRVGVYGFGNIGAAWEQLKLLSAAFPDIEFKGERDTSLFDEAVSTKDAAEIALMREVGERTCAVMQAVWDFIAGHRAANGTVVKADGSALTVGDVKRFLRVRLLEFGLSDPNDETIFAIGRDAGFPHSRGQDGDALKLGQAIVFDLFPRDLRSGYYHDMTRTWSIGYAVPEVEKAYGEVRLAYDKVMESLKVGEKTQKYQLLACDVLEECGHPTVRSQPGTTTGYMHSLGHGLGLEIHERPSFTHLRDDDVVQVGSVFSVEPGVYYPERGFGVRIEDTVYMDESGQARSLTPFRKDLVLSLKS